jgi:glycosyltransferase involved in cell wall biosynthesis
LDGPWSVRAYWKQPVKILLTSFLFPPSIGGIETVSMILAREFVAAGHEVKVATPTPGPTSYDAGFEVIREPTFEQLREALRWCDVFFQSNISLQLAAPLLVVRRPWVIVHHTWIPHGHGPKSWVDDLKRLLLCAAHSISISTAVAESLPVASRLIPNPYDSSTFYLRPEIPRTKPLVAMGRLVSDKGFDLLVQALARLGELGHRPPLTLIGSGPERTALEQQAEELGVRGQITFIDALTGAPLAEELCAHEIMVIPSRWREPFGVVALEGIACGCVPVGSQDGGLRDAIGPCGVTFPNGDSDALAAALARLFEKPEQVKELRVAAAEHLARHQPAAVAEGYLAFFEEARQSSAPLL